jgi:phospholipase/carboxylesterase
LLIAGEPLGSAHAAMLLVHGRGATAEDIMTVGAELHQPGFAYLAPQAAGGTWYPNRFMAPFASNEPWLNSALGVLETLLNKIGATIPPERVLFLGFSQGACLTLEFAARHARRYGGLVGLTGALIGPDGTPRDYAGSFAGTPTFLGCSDVDPHVSKERVVEAGEVLKRMGATVELRLYPGMGHTVNEDELAAVRTIMLGLSA